MVEALTKRQSEILELIKDYIVTHGSAPTRQDIARQMGFSSANAAEQHLRALERKGYIEIISGSSRGIRLLEESGLPVIGEVAAGEPMLATENIQERYEINADMFHPVADYLLRVRGHSMHDAGIRHGDLIAVHVTKQVKNGQIVIARIDDDVTVKEYRRSGDIVELIPHNPEFEVLKVNLNKEHLEIEGIGVGLVRIGDLL